MKDVKFEDWRLTVFWIAVAAATAIAGFVFGWSWRDRSGALANVSLLAALTAVGTVGALFAAIGIAGWQYRIQREERHAEAMLVLGEAYPRFVVFLAALTDCTETFDNLEKVDLGAQDVGRAIANIQVAYQKANMPAPKQLLPLKDAYSHSLAVVISQLHPLVSFGEYEVLASREGRLHVARYMQQGIKVAMPLVESLSEAGYALLKEGIQSSDSRRV